MFWPKEEKQKYQKIDLMNDGLEVSVQIDLRPKSWGYIHAPQSPKDSRNQPQRRSSVFGLGSPFASNSTNRYLLTTNKNNYNDVSSNNLNTTPVRQNTHKNSIGSEKQSLLDGTIETSVRARGESLSLFVDDQTKNDSNSNRLSHVPIIPSLSPSSCTNNQSNNNNHGDENIMISSSHLSPKYSFLTKPKLESPPQPRRRRFNSLRSSLSFSNMSNGSNHIPEEEDSNFEAFTHFDQTQARDESCASICDADTSISWLDNFDSGLNSASNESNSVEGRIERVSILIDSKDGVITFQMQDFESDEHHDDDNNSDECGEHDIIVENEDATITSSCNKSRDAVNSVTGPSTFELSSTNHQRDLDNEKKQFHSIRLACLEVAAEQYKKINIEVPDIVVAQVNEHRHQLHEYNKQFQRNNANINSSQEILDEHNNNNDEIKDENSSLKRPRMKKRTSFHTRKRIRLRQNDQIHVSPCQCALNLVGMRGKLGSESLFQNLLIPQKQYNQQQQESVKQEGYMKSNSSRNSLKSMKSSKSKLVRTSSAVVTDGKRVYALESDNDTSKRKTSYPLSRKYRSDSGTFDAVGYHEITLIRNRNSSACTNTATPGRRFFMSRKNANGEKVKNEFADLLDWDAITIRCANHDELDMLVKALSDSSKAKVIPFSTNPKEKLKESLRHELNPNRTRLLSDPSHSLYADRLSNGSLHCNFTPAQKTSSIIGAIREDKPMILKSSSSDNLHMPIESEGNQHIIEADTKSRINEATKKKSDHNFNKKEYCEFCDLTFTLLTRRHHCRKCQRSICGNCSCMLLIKGGDEKRFCNSCSAEILRRQSEALHGRWRNRYLQSDKLPGKVHDACHRLGVGTMGKLPHWRNFLTTKINDRPAVGRITIELLEAIALPSVNMLNGTVDPYVRATITGYDRDMRWTLREWMPEKRYQLCSGYVSATLCPRWNGPGRKGGVLLTLPIISTAGAVLRLEVLDHNLMRNSRGKDIVLGLVEIPLSDLPNANLRQPDGVRINSNNEKKSLLYDGYCDRWYRLLSSDQASSSSVILSKPIPSPHLDETKKKVKKPATGLKSLEEIGKKVQGLCIQPIEWFASVIKLDLPSRPEAFYEEHRKRSMIHVRIKLNASVAGDALSHSWFPPVVKYPPVPPFEPEILWTRILHVSKQLAPYRNIQQYVEKIIKWELEPKECSRAYFIFAAHLLLLPYLVKIFHVYLFIFLHVQWRKMKAEEAENDSNMADLPHVDSMDSIDMAMTSNETASNFQNSPSLTELTRKEGNTSNNESNSTKDPPAEGEKEQHAEKEDAAKLNIAVNWIAKAWLDNKGLEILQHKLGNLGRDLKNLNSVWNGSNPLLTKAAMVYIAISFILHFLINARLLWLMGTFTWYFVQSPTFVLFARMFFGFWRGVAKGMRRQHLLNAELLEEM